jgi:hypothetical protein
MLANTLNICSDEELEHDGAQAEDGKLMEIISIVYLILFFFF